MVSGSSVSDVVRCPFWRGAGNFAVEFCDYFVHGAPACVVAEGWSESDPFVLEELESMGVRVPDVCDHFIRSESGVKFQGFCLLYTCPCNRANYDLVLKLLRYV